jgi:PHS family inorganic phosphate transporter-like MFS transporter
VRKVGVIVGAFVVQNYTLNGKEAEIKGALIVLAFTNMLGFFCSFLVTETKRRLLEEISREDEQTKGEGRE